MVKIACEIIDLFDEGFLHSRLGTGQGRHGALSERNIHFGLRFLVRVFNSAVMNLAASEAVKGP